MLYIKTDASGVGLREGLLWVRQGMTYSRDTTLDNSIVRPKVLASNRL